MIDDKKLVKYINDYYFESHFRNLEDEMLRTLILNYKENPTEENDNLWLDFSVFVSRRRGYDNS